MFVSMLLVEQEERPFRSWNDIHQAILELDGDRTTEVMICRDADNHLMIGGGAQGLFHVSALVKGTVYEPQVPTLVGIRRIKMQIGGQQVSVSAEKLLKAELALETAKVFAETGSLNPRISWIEI